MGISIDLYKLRNARHIRFHLSNTSQQCEHEVSKHVSALERHNEALKTAVTLDGLLLAVFMYFIKI